MNAGPDERYRRLAQALPQLVWTLDPAGRLDFVNDRWVAYTGLSLEETAGEARAGAFHPVDAIELADAWRAARAAREPFERPARIRRAADGVLRWFSVRVAPVYDAEGALAWWVAVAVDVDDRVRAEQALSLLSEVSDVIGTASDEERLYVDVAQLASRTIADWFAVYLRHEHSELRLVTVAHSEPHEGRRAAQLLHADALGGGDAIVARIRSVEAALLPSVERAGLAESLDLGSAIVVPLRIRQEQAGMLVLLRGSTAPAYDRSDLRTAELLAKRVSLAVENVRQYHRQQRVVDSFQRAALPKSLPQVADLRLDAVYTAASDYLSVGGDWYDAFPLPDGRLVITIGDVAGKGLDAAVLMATVRQSIRVAALQGLEPSAILAATEAALQLEYRDRLVTAFVGIIDTRTWTIAYASAGHPPALVRRPDGSLLELEGVGLPLGVPIEAQRRTRQLIGVPPGSLIVLYTDGLIESTHDVIEGESRLREALRHDALLHAASPASLIRDLVLTGNPDDDVAILTLTLGRETHWSFESGDAVAAQSVRSSFVAALSREADESSDLAAAELIFGELVGNVVRYAPGAIDIDLEWTGNVPILHVLDRGSGFDLSSSLPADLMSERGRGLYIVSVLGADLRADRLPLRGNHVRVALPIRRRV